MMSKGNNHSFTFITIIAGLWLAPNIALSSQVWSQTEHLQSPISLTEELEKIQTAWNEINVERTLANFDKWRVSRQRTLSELRKFQDEFNKIHFYSGSAKTAGNGAALLGSLATLIGFGLSFSKPWNPFGTELMEYGSTAGCVGGVTSITASLVEYGFSESVLKEVKATLEEDRRRTEELLDWFQRNKELDNQLRAVFGCGVTNIDDILTAVREVSIIYSRGGNALSNIRSYLTALVKKNLPANRLPNLDNKKLGTIIYKANYKVKQILLEFCDNSAVRKVVRGIYDSFQKTPITFAMSKTSVSVMVKAKVRGLGFLQVFATAKSQTLRRTVSLAAKGMFQTINVAVDVFYFLSEIDDIKNGKSKYSEMVEKTRDYLQMELEALELYPMLKNEA